MNDPCRGAGHWSRNLLAGALAMMAASPGFSQVGRNPEAPAKQADSPAALDTQGLARDIQIAFAGENKIPWGQVEKIKERMASRYDDSHKDCWVGRGDACSFIETKPDKFKVKPGEEKGSYTARLVIATRSLVKSEKVEIYNPCRQKNELVWKDTYLTVRQLVVRTGNVQTGQFNDEVTTLSRQTSSRTYNPSCRY